MMASQLVNIWKHLMNQHGEYYKVISF